MKRYLCSDPRSTSLFASNPDPSGTPGNRGGVLLREIMERTRTIEWMVERLDDPRTGDRVTYPLADLLRTLLHLLGQGWRDQGDVDAPRYDAGLRLAASG